MDDVLILTTEAVTIRSRCRGLDPQEFRLSSDSRYRIEKSKSCQLVSNEMEIYDGTYVKEDAISIHLDEDQLSRMERLFPVVSGGTPSPANSFDEAMKNDFFMATGITLLVFTACCCCACCCVVVLRCCGAGWNPCRPCNCCNSADREDKHWYSNRMVLKRRPRRSNRRQARLDANEGVEMEAAL